MGWLTGRKRKREETAGGVGPAALGFCGVVLHVAERAACCEKHAAEGSARAAGELARRAGVSEEAAVAALRAGFASRTTVETFRTAPAAEGVH